MSEETPVKRKRGRPRTRPPKPPSYPAYQRQDDFRLYEPWYHFGIKGPSVVAWVNGGICPIFYGTYDDCQALLRDFNRVPSARRRSPSSARAAGPGH